MSHIFRIFAGAALAAVAVIPGLAQPQASLVGEDFRSAVPRAAPPLPLRNR